MSEYHLPYQNVPSSTPSSPSLYAAVTSRVQVSASASDSSPIRRCSVRGCSAVLPPDNAPKMCETCRGRHRIYASTKRAKRKLEKAAVGLQNDQPVVWMPSDDNATTIAEQQGVNENEIPSSSAPALERLHASQVSVVRILKSAFSPHPRRNSVSPLMTRLSSFSSHLQHPFLHRRKPSNFHRTPSTRPHLRGSTMRLTLACSPVVPLSSQAR